MYAEVLEGLFVMKVCQLRFELRIAEDRCDNGYGFRPYR